MNKAVFLDRDGVINLDKEYIYRIEDFEFIDGVFESCLEFVKLGYLIFIVTNQSGISRGYFSESQFKENSHWTLKEFKKRGIQITEIFYCPHGDKSKCYCRKPKPGLFINAKKKHNIDLKHSWMIGDKETDIKAANNAGINNTILVRSGHKIDELNSNAQFILDSIKETNQVIKD